MNLEQFFCGMIGAFIGFCITYGWMASKWNALAKFPRLVMPLDETTDDYANEVVDLLQNRIKGAAVAAQQNAEYHDLLSMIDYNHLLDKCDERMTKQLTEHQFDTLNHGCYWLTTFLRVLHVCGLRMTIEQVPFEDCTPDHLPDDEEDRTVTRRTYHDE